MNRLLEVVSDVVCLLKAYAFVDVVKFLRDAFLFDFLSGLLPTWDFNICDFDIFVFSIKVDVFNDGTEHDLNLGQFILDFELWERLVAVVGLTLNI